MCGRYEFNITLEELISRYNIKNSNIIINPIKEVFPSMNVPVIIENINNKEIKIFKWGFDVTFSKKPIINARSETVNTKPTFTDSFYNRRCIIPASSFFEWEKVENRKIKHKIHIDNNIFSMAGIYNKNRDKEGKEYFEFTILTKMASNNMKKIHERMPVLLQKSDEDKWLDNSIRDFNKLDVILKNSLNEVVIE